MVENVLYSRHYTAMSLYFKTFAGHRLYHSPSIEIRQNIWYRWLMLHDRTYIQTLIQRQRPERAVMPYLIPFSLAVRAQPGPACLLGLGGGGFPHMAAPFLHHHPITAVEINTEVIAVAHQYFMLDTIPSLSTVHQDAAIFMSECNTTYQHILIDIYSDSGFPKTCAHPAFFEYCKQHLFDNGFLTLNLVHTQRDFPILTMVQSIFQNATLCIPVPASSNMIVIASPSQAALQADIMNHPQLRTLIWDPIFGRMARMVNKL